MRKGIAALLALTCFFSCFAFPCAGEEAASGSENAALSMADGWRRLFAGEQNRLYLFGTDDPSLLPITGRHAFVVLGYALENGEMTEELKGRCDAAAAAALSFPDSILICSGGASGDNNPEGRTEAGLMKAYLTQTCGIAPERIFIDERAQTTAENAVNTLAILRQNGIETMTLVTSAYHQPRSQSLYRAAAALYERAYGYTVDLVGNFCLDYAPADNSSVMEAMIAVAQLAQILNLPEEELAALPDPD